MAPIRICIEHGVHVGPAATGRSISTTAWPLFGHRSLEGVRDGVFMHFPIFNALLIQGLCGVMLVF